MQIINIDPPHSANGLSRGIATSKRGRRYGFLATPDGKIHSLWRYTLDPPSPDGFNFSEEMNAQKPPRTLAFCVRRAVRVQRKESARRSIRAHDATE